MITAMLRGRGYKINHKRVYRIWRSLGLKVPEKQPKRRRLWLNDGSCIRLRAEHANHVWSYDFVEAKTSKGRKIKILNIIDEYTRECLSSHAAFRIRSEDRVWLSEMEVSTMYITPGSPWENGFVESFNGTMANELLNREIFDTLHEAKVLLARWVLEYNTKRPHSALGYRPPAPEAYLWAI